MANLEWTKLSEQEGKTFITNRLKEIDSSLSPDTTVKYAEELYGYYKRLKVFPKSSELLDISIKAWLNQWTNRSGFESKLSH